MLYKKTKGHGNQDIVLLHGWGVNSAIWDAFTNVLEDRFRVTLIDLPGFGRSLHSPADYSMDNIVSIIAPEIPKKSIMVGWSLGGMIATKLALHDTQLVKGLVTIASNPCFIAQDNWPGMAADQFSVFAKHLGEDYAATLKRFLALQFYGVESGKAHLRQVQSLLMHAPEPTVNVLEASLSLLKRTDLRLELLNITVPMLALFGKMDAMVPKQVSESVLSYNPMITTRVIDQAGHAAFISHPNDCLREITDWISQYD